ncbi:MAG: hypothetical protein D0530_01380 [Methylococcales bacterium]|nr:MAG: hypothetical protein D0530_01380 [Methylococcales bacterium]
MFFSDLLLEPPDNINMQLKINVSVLLAKAVQLKLALFVRLLIGNCANKNKHNTVSLKFRSPIPMF